MRQIKFRGKRVDNGEWVYGDYFKTPLTDENSGLPPDSGWFFLTGKTNHCIGQDGVAFVVDPATVSQFTGLLDKNGKEIWEGDVIKFQKFANYNDEITNLSRHTAKVVFIDGSFSWHILRYGANGCFHNSRKIEPLNNTCATWGFEVIGNLHDSPSLTNH